MEHETGSGWTGSPAQMSDEDNGGNGVGSKDAAASRDEADRTGTGWTELARIQPAGTQSAGTEAGGIQPAGTEPAGTEASGTEPDTGNERVDAALRLLDRLPGLPVSEHSQLFEQVHAQLSDVLGELDSGR